MESFPEKFSFEALQSQNNQSTLLAETRVRIVDMVMRALERDIKSIDFDIVRLTDESVVTLIRELMTRFPGNVYQYKMDANLSRHTKELVRDQPKFTKEYINKFLLRIQ